MILQALVEHYEDLLKQGRIAKPGWGKVKVSYGLNLDRQGHVLGLIPLKVAQETGGSKKKRFCCADDGSTSSGEEIRGGLPELFVRQCDLYSWC